MLADSAQNEELAALLRDPRLQVQIPDDLLKNFFNETGYVSTTVEEQRARARLRVRLTAKISFANFPNRYQESEDAEMLTIVKDLSRTGIAILYHQQIFPEDVFRVFFLGRVVTCVAVRCRKLGPQCYETGARVFETVVIDEDADE